MSDRKQRFTVNAALCLTHDIQFANHNKKILSALLLNVKKAFDHVSLTKNHEKSTSTLYSYQVSSAISI